MNRQDAEIPTEISVVVPAHDSGPLLDGTVAALAVRLRGRAAEIIVVENGSTDRTYERALRLLEQWTDQDPVLVVLQSNPGMGNAMRVGIAASRGRQVLLTADDLPFGFDDIDAADNLAGRGEGYPTVIVGSKAHPASNVSRGLVRGVLTWGYLVLRRWILRMRTGDPQGTLIVEGELLRRVSPLIREPGYLFTTELVFVLERMGYESLEVPVTLRSVHGEHRSRVKLVDAVAMAIGLLRVRNRHIRTQRWDPDAAHELPKPS